MAACPDFCLHPYVSRFFSFLFFSPWTIFLGKFYFYILPSTRLLPYTHLLPSIYHPSCPWSTEGGRNWNTRRPHRHLGWRLDRVQGRRYSHTYHLVEQQQLALEGDGKNPGYQPVVPASCRRSTGHAGLCGLCLNGKDWLGGRLGLGYRCLLCWCVCFVLSTWWGGWVAPGGGRYRLRGSPFWCGICYNSESIPPFLFEHSLSLNLAVPSSQFRTELFNPDTKNAWLLGLSIIFSNPIKHPYTWETFLVILHIVRRSQLK